MAMDQPQEPIEGMDQDGGNESSIKLTENDQQMETTENSKAESADMEMVDVEEIVDQEALISSLLEEIFSAKSIDGKKNTLKEVEAIFRNNSRPSPAIVKLFLDKFLLQTLQSEGLGPAHKEKLKKLAENLLFVENRKFLKRIISHLLKIQNLETTDDISSEDADKILIFMLDTSQKLRNIPKFVLHILRAAKASGVEKVNFSNAFREKLAECVIKMPVSQNFAVWSNVCDTLQQEYTEFTASPAGSYANVQAAAEFASISLLNVKLVDYVVRDETASQVGDSFSTLESKLKLLIEMATRNPQTFARPLLKIVFALGELHQLLLLYSQPFVKWNASRGKGPNEADETGEMEAQLQKVAEMTAYADIDLWTQIILQTARRHLLFSSCGKEDKNVQNLIGFLVDHFSDCQELWLNNIRYLLPYMTPKQIQIVGREIVRSQEMHRVLLDAEVVERRSFQMAVVNAVFYRLAEPEYDKQKIEDDPETCPVPPESAGVMDVLVTLTQKPRVWISSIDGSTKEVSKWLRQSAEWIRKMMEGTEQGAKTSRSWEFTRVLDPAEKLSGYLDLIDKLPLEYTTGSVHSTLVMGLVSILLSQAETTNTPVVKDRIWMMIVRLLDNPEKLSSLYDYLPSAAFLSWAVEDVKNLKHSEIIFVALFDEVLKSPQGLKDLADWIQSADFRRHFDVMIVSLEKMIQYDQTVSNEAKKKLSSQMLDALQTRFLDCFEACFDDFPVHVLKGALCLLKLTQRRPAAAPSAKPSAAKTGPARTPGEEPAGESEETCPTDSGTLADVVVATEEPSKVKRLLRKLSQLVEVARKGLLSADESSGSASAHFLGFLFSHQKRFADFLPARMRISVWDAYRQSCQPLRWEDHLIENLLASSRQKELTLMINGILQDLQSVSLKVDPYWSASDDIKSTQVVLVDELRRVSSFFRHLMATDMKNQSEQCRTLRLQAIQTALPLVQHVILVLCHETDEQVVDLILPVMGIYLSLLSTGKFHGYPQDIASALHACLTLPLDEHMSHQHFIGIFTAIYKVIQYLLTKHEEIAADRIPVLLQAFRRLLAVTATRSDQRRKGDSSEVADLAECANRLSRLASIINSQRVRYRRVAAYLVADLMEQFQKRTLYPAVKHDLLTTLHHLLDILDQHASRYLLSILPAGVRELFRVEYEQFDRFYRFKGKV